MIFFLILILFISVTLHEYFHGWIAYKLGDSTPKDNGRLTLNPLAHIDPFGTIILPFLLLVISKGDFSFGYAKPVPINPYHFKNPKKDMMWVGMAGPLANLLIAFFLRLILIIPFFSFLSEGIHWGITINIILAIFNLIPLPPLDGSRIVVSFLPYKIAYNYLKMETLGFFIIVFLTMIGFFDWFIFPLVKIILSFLGIKI